MQQKGSPAPTLDIERIIGMSQLGSANSSPTVDASTCSQSALAIHPRNGDIAYIAGCFIVIFGVRTSRQEVYLKNDKHRPFQCLAYSKSGDFFAAGDAISRQPEITLWKIGKEMENNGRNYTQIAKLSGHKYGIQSLKFSPNQDYLLSLGDSNDMGLLCWDTVTFERVTSNRLGRVVNSLDFHREQNFFVTAGYSHLKFWYFDQATKKVVKSQVQKAKENIQESFTADLTKVAVKIFVGVLVYKESVFALSCDGNLYMFNHERKLQKWMNIKVQRAFDMAIDTTKDQLYCGCADGILRVFNPVSLQHIITVQKPPPLGQSNVETGVKKIKVPSQQTSKYSDVLAVIADETTHRILVVYSDKMVFLWDVKDTSKTSVVRTFLSHNGPIHDIQRVKPEHQIGLSDNDPRAMESIQKDKAVTRFATCSSDRTVRFWHFIDNTTLQTSTRSQVQAGLFRNAYCKDMSKILFVKLSDELTRHDYDVFKAKPLDRDQEGQEILEGSSKAIEVMDDIIMRRNQDIEQAIRCLRISTDGKFLACGDWHGNIRVHDLKKPQIEEVKCIEAHDNEVLTVDFAAIHPENNLAESEITDGQLLASGSRDQLIQIFDSRQDFEPVQIIDQHQGTVSSIKFLSGLENKNDQIVLLSSGADMQLAKHSFRKGSTIDDLEPFKQVGLEQLSNKVFGLDVSSSSNSGEQLVLLGQGRNLSLRKVEDLDGIWEKRPDPSKKMVPDHTKVMLDDNGRIAVVSSTDFQISLFEVSTGQLLCRAKCGELTTGFCFSQNNKHLISTSSQGIIYVWKLPSQVSQILNQPVREKSSEQALRQMGLSKIPEDEFEDSLKRESSRPDASASKSPMKMPHQMESVQSDLASVFAQIGKVNSLVENIQNQKSEQQHDMFGELLKLAGEPSDDKQEEEKQIDKPPLPQKQAPVDEAPSPSSSVQQPQPNISKPIYQSSTPQNVSLNFGNQGELPRWALSVVGASENPDTNQTTNRNSQNEGSESDRSMQKLFEKNLKSVSQVEQPRLFSREVQMVEQPEKKDPGMKQGEVQILTDTLEDNTPDQLDEDELMIQKQLDKKKFQSIYGIEGEESVVSQNLRKSREQSSRIRRSIASKYFNRQESSYSISDFRSMIPAGQQSQLQEQEASTDQKLQKNKFFTDLPAEADLKQKTPQAEVPSKILTNSSKPLAFEKQPSEPHPEEKKHAPNPSLHPQLSKTPTAPSPSSKPQQPSPAPSQPSEAASRIPTSLDTTNQSPIKADGVTPLPRVDDMTISFSDKDPNLSKIIPKPPSPKVKESSMKADQPMAPVYGEVKPKTSPVKKEPKPISPKKQPMPKPVSPKKQPLPKAQSPSKSTQEVRKIAGELANNEPSANDLAIKKRTSKQKQEEEKKRSHTKSPIPTRNERPTFTSNWMPMPNKHMHSTSVLKQQDLSSLQGVSLIQKAEPNQSVMSTVTEDVVESQVKNQLMKSLSSQQPSHQTSFHHEDPMSSIVNFQLQCEIERINNSLKNIDTILTQAQSLKSGMSEQQSMASGINQTQDVLRGLETGVSHLSSSSSFLQKFSSQSQHPVAINPTVSQDLTKTMCLWNNMMAQIESKTSLDVQKLSQTSTRISRDLNLQKRP